MALDYITMTDQL